MPALIYILQLCGVVGYSWLTSSEARRLAMAQKMERTVRETAPFCGMMDAALGALKIQEWKMQEL